MAVRFRPIQLLSVALRNQIAAGEVIERPASAMKELVENSLDAQAQHIDVCLENGGRDMLRVQDDGSGIPKEFLALALTRHATSKLADSKDLEAIQTFGFRGEALPSIAQVSRFTLDSAYDGEGYVLRCSFGHIEEPMPSALPKGTCVTVCDLFGNTPARLKFLKTPQTEVKRAQECLFRIALAHLDVGFSFAVGEKVLFRFQQNESVAVRLASFWPDEVIEQLRPFHAESDGLIVHGFAAPPTATQQRAHHIYLYVNGRPVQDKNLLAAVKEAYKGQLISREYPQCILFLEIDPHEVDVNVHPQKTEVRFQNESVVFRACVKAVGSVLGGMSANQQMAVARESHASVDPQPVGHSMPKDHTPRPAGFWGSMDTVPLFGKKKEADLSDVATALFGQDIGKKEAEPSPRKPLGWPENWVYLGQVCATYLLLQDATQSLLIIDQHAAHERVLFERLTTKSYAGKSQQLMVPLECAIHPVSQQRLMDVRETLLSMGYDWRVRENTVLIEGIPPLLGEADALAFFKSVLLEEKDDATALLERMACRAAIKAGQILQTEEVRDLLWAWYACPHRGFCPHGRPTILSWDAAFFEKAFKRK
ncbi:MAG: DNA mismatch repair endonuclease MutL [Desulfovibrio sp.]|nr:DNA mismatch repair endonuclease MutL [Desulfovibrio sp.]